MVTLTAIMLAAGLFGARATSWLLLRGVPSADSMSSLFAIWDPGGMWLFGGFSMAAIAGIAWTRIGGLSALDAADTRRVVAPVSSRSSGSGAS
jgi:prolipoprotein diacylglyceryltransferase